MIWTEPLWQIPHYILWVLLGLVGVLSYAVLLCVHRLYFNQLSRFPGPFFARLTDAYSAFHSYRGDMHYDIQKCHEKYGNVIRYGPNRVLTNSGPDYQNIYGHGKPVRKAQSYATMVPWKGGETTALSIDKTMHKGLRHSFVSGLSASTLKHFEPAVLKNVEIYFRKLSEGPDAEAGWTQARDMNQWNKWLAMDTMADFGFGIRIGLLEDPETRYILEILHLHIMKLGVYEQWPSLSNIGIADTIGRALPAISPTMQRFNSWLQDFSEKIITNNQDTSRGILGHIVEGLGTKNSTNGLTKEQVLAEGSSTTFTASEGISTTISAVQFYLSHNPSIHNELEAEIRAKFEHGESISWGPALSSCEYLRACIDEALRLVPPSSGAHWRETERRGLSISGEDIPPGCEVGVSTFALFRNSQIFRDENQFWPKRWIEGVLPEDELARARTALKPFSTGPRNCPGQHAALMIVSVTLANLVNEYDFKLADGPMGDAGVVSPNAHEDGRTGSELQFDNHFTSTWEEGPYIQFRKRAV